MRALVPDDILGCGVTRQTGGRDNEAKPRRPLRATQEHLAIRDRNIERAANLLNTVDLGDDSHHVPAKGVVVLRRRQDRGQELKDHLDKLHRTADLDGDAFIPDSAMARALLLGGVPLITLPLIPAESHPSALSVTTLGPPHAFVVPLPRLNPATHPRPVVRGLKLYVVSAPRSYWRSRRDGSADMPGICHKPMAMRTGACEQEKANVWLPPSVVLMANRCVDEFVSPFSLSFVIGLPAIVSDETVIATADVINPMSTHFCPAVPMFVKLEGIENDAVFCVVLATLSVNEIGRGVFFWCAPMKPGIMDHAPLIAVR
jgi:hypothetical protein